MKHEYPNLNVIDHPLIKHKLTQLRDQDTNTERFRRLVREVGQMLAYEVTRDLPTENVTIRTPMAQIASPIISGKKQCIVSILRAGNGMLDGMLELLPTARVGHIGLYRDPATLEPVEYYFKVPEDIAYRVVSGVDPTLAPGNSPAAATDRIKEHALTPVKRACLLPARERVKWLLERHPDVSVTVASLGDRLTDPGYIVPVLGDAGGRLFGTR